MINRITDAIISGIIDADGVIDFRIQPIAAAVIMALREPTPEMIEAGENAGCGVADFRTAAELTWLAMIDAALAEKKSLK